MTNASIHLRIQRDNHGLTMAVIYAAEGHQPQLMAEYPLSPTGVSRARAYAKEMRIVYGILAEYDAKRAQANA